MTDTEALKALLEVGNELRQQWLQEVTDSLSGEERQQYCDVLTRFSAALMENKGVLERMLASQTQTAGQDMVSRVLKFADSVDTPKVSCEGKWVAEKIREAVNG